MKNKILVGLSGGVDSSVSLKILKEKGFDIEALFMKNWDDGDSSSGCNAAEDLEYAIDVCDKLNVKLNTANFSDDYWNKIFLNFIESYKSGYTPNPDILCNKYIKFKIFIDHAKKLGFNKIATGHYAKIVMKNNYYFLEKPLDENKDQTYFLHTLDQSQLKNVIFPLSNLKKEDVKLMAKKSNFKSYKKKESMGICFIGNKKFKDFIKKYIKNRPGPIYNDKSEIIGEHSGMFFTTIGQREGIGIGGIKNTKSLPWYVYKKDVSNNSLYVCQGNQNKLLFSDCIYLKDMSVITNNINDVLGHRLLCQIRHLGEKYLCTVNKTIDDKILVKTEKPIRAVAPGQSLALFDKNFCMGGGIISDDKFSKN